jgi:hypothetical protein
LKELQRRVNEAVKHEAEVKMIDFAKMGARLKPKDEL